MNATITVFIICVGAIIYLLLYNLHDCTFKQPVLTAICHPATVTAGSYQIEIYSHFSCFFCRSILE